MSRTLKEKQTYEDYLKTPTGGKYQLIDGEIIEMTSQTPNHQNIVLTLGILLKKFANENKSGVSEYWIVDAEEKNIEIYENSNSGFQKIILLESGLTYTSKKLTGFILKAEDVFN